MKLMMPNLSMHISSTSTETRYKVQISPEKIILNKRFSGNSNGQIISKRLGNRCIFCRHLVHGFLTLGRVLILNSPK